MRQIKKINLVAKVKFFSIDYPSIFNNLKEIKTFEEPYQKIFMLIYVIC